MKSINGEVHTDSDAAMAALQPVNRWRHDYTLATMTTWTVQKYRTHSVTIAAIADHTCDILLDGSNVTGNWTTIEGTNFTVTQMELSHGVHRFNSSCNRTYSVLYYGQAYNEAFATVVGETEFATNCTQTEPEISTLEPTTIVSSITTDADEYTTHDEVVTTTVELTSSKSTSQKACPICVGSTSSTTVAVCPEGEWDTWGVWAECSSTCGVGFQSRARECQTANCIGNNKQHQICVLPDDCPEEPCTDKSLLIHINTIYIYKLIANRQHFFRTYYLKQKLLLTVFEIY